MGQSFHAICLAKEVDNAALCGFQFAGNAQQKLLL
jgi:hypothetical protein